MNSGNSSTHRSLKIWLLTGCTMIVMMVLIGGITRLTDSGLSMVQWEPILGAIPPMDNSEWNSAFEQYKAYPEYKVLNRDMDLGGFKQIFFWEYLHRNWGRLMGLVFFIPFVFFWRRGQIKGWLFKRSLTILFAGGAVGALGWFMVKSGLVDRPDVSHYRLAIHFCAALMVLVLVQWTYLDLSHAPMRWRALNRAGKWLRGLLGLLVVQIIWGAFTAGLDAGGIYNTWPLMDGQFMPDNVRAFNNWIKDLSDHRDGVQFIHRNFAWLVAAGFIGVAVHFRRSPEMSSTWRWLVIAVAMQFILGVCTVLMHVPILLGALHQLGAVILLMVLMAAIHATAIPRFGQGA